MHAKSHETKRVNKSLDDAQRLVQIVPPLKRSFHINCNFKLSLSMFVLYDSFFYPCLKRRQGQTHKERFTMYNIR